MFNRSHEKFRRTLEQEQARGRRTTFLEDDVPSTSRQQHAPTPGNRARSGKRYPTKTANTRVISSDRTSAPARHFRMTVWQPSDECPSSPICMPSKNKREAGELFFWKTMYRALVVNNLRCDADEECPPPPPIVDDACPPLPVLNAEQEIIILDSDEEEKTMRQSEVHRVI